MKKTNKKNEKNAERPRKSSKSDAKPVRYAVVGLGHIAQVAVLPAFANAKSNSQLAALISDDPEKLEKLGKKYKVDALYNYERFSECLKEHEIDAVYIALPNSMHCEFAVQAAEAGVHILCEKPLGTSVAECVRMIKAAEKADVRLMTAYRLHFDKTNMAIVNAIENGDIGDPKVFSSVFSYQVADDNIRLDPHLGGGALFDIGVYCINAARYIFQDEPIAVYAHMIRGQDERFKEVEGTCAAILRFPNQRVAQFTCSFGAEESSYYEVIGTEGCVCADPAYEYAEPLSFEIQTKTGRTRTKKDKKHDQFAAEIAYFSDCVLNGTEPEPSGYEGLADLRVIEALYQSAETGDTIFLEKFSKNQRPSAEQVRTFPALNGEPKLINAAPPVEH